jgi:hypothetical protein
VEIDEVSDSLYFFCCINLPVSPINISCEGANYFHWQVLIGGIKSQDRGEREVEASKGVKWEIKDNCILLGWE